MDQVYHEFFLLVLHHLLWQRLLVLFSQQEIDALDQFGNRYGQEALQKRFWSMISMRLSTSVEEFSTEIVDEAKERAEKLATTITLAGKGKTGSIAQKLDVIGPSMLIKTPVLSNLSHALFRDIVALRFWQTVIEVHFSPQEQHILTGDLAGKNRDIAVLHLRQEVERRTGRSLGILVQEVQTDIVTFVGAASTQAAYEVKKIHSQGLSQELLTAWKTGNAAKAAQIFLQI